MNWIKAMTGKPCELHNIFLEIEKARDEQKMVTQQVVQSSAKNRLTIAQSGIQGIEKFFKGLTK